MNQTTTTLLLGAIIAVGFGIYGVSEISDTQFPTPSDSSFMTGHLTLTAYDENGNIKQYVQTDNVVLNTADNCISSSIFAHDSGDTCTLAVGGFDFVAIGIGNNATTPKEAWGDPLPITFDSSIAATTVALTEVTTGIGGAATLVTATFVDVDADIDEAALRDTGGSGSAGNALAYQQFTLISLGINDDLTVEWTITIDGT